MERKTSGAKETAMKGWEYQQEYKEDLIEDGVIFECDDFTYINKYEGGISLLGNYTREKLQHYQDATGLKFTPRYNTFVMKVNNKLKIVLE